MKRATTIHSGDGGLSFRWLCLVLVLMSCLFSSPAMARRVNGGLGGGVLVPPGVPPATVPPQFDLTGYILQRLSDAGICKAEALRLDTYSDSDRFYSYRRSTHRNEPSYGRQISMIGLPIKS